MFRAGTSDPWSWSAALNAALTFCVWALLVDGLHALRSPPRRRRPLARRRPRSRWLACLVGGRPRRAGPARHRRVTASHPRSYPPRPQRPRSLDRHTRRRRRPARPGEALPGPLERLARPPHASADPRAAPRPRQPTTSTGNCGPPAWPTIVPGTALARGAPLVMRPSHPCATIAGRREGRPARPRPTGGAAVWKRTRTDGGCARAP